MLFETSVRSRFGKVDKSRQKSIEFEVDSTFGRPSHRDSQVGNRPKKVSTLHTIRDDELAVLYHNLLRILRDSTLPALLPTNVLNTTNPTGSCSTGTFSVSVDSPFHVNNLVNPNAPSRAVQCFICKSWLQNPGSMRRHLYSHLLSVMRSLGMNTDTFKKGAKKRKTNVERRSKKIKKFSKYSKDSNSDDDDEDDEALCPSNMPQKPPEGPPPPPPPPPPSASITA